MAPGESQVTALKLAVESISNLLTASTLAPYADDYVDVRNALMELRKELSDRMSDAGFPWHHVKVGSTFYHSRFITAGRKPELCEIFRISRDDDGHVKEVFYNIGQRSSMRVYNDRFQFPAAVKEWVNV